MLPQFAGSNPADNLLMSDHRLACCLSGSQTYHRYLVELAS